MRSAGNDTSTPTTNATTNATGERLERAPAPTRDTRMPVVYAPMPKNAEWPMEIWPVKPSSRLSAIAAAISVSAVMHESIRPLLADWWESRT